MKKIIIRICLCISIISCLASDVLAQEKKPMNMPVYDNEPYHYGFIIGLNQMFYSIDFKDGYKDQIYDKSLFPSISGISDSTIVECGINDIRPGIKPGFTVGVVGNLRLAKYFDLRLIPSLSLGDKIVYYNISVATKNDGIKDVAIYSETDHVCIELPIQLKYRSKRNNNTAAYIIAGANYKIDMYSRKNMYEMDVNSKQTTKPTAIITNRQDIAAEIGAGFDFYTGYFKLGVEIKMSYGLLDVAKHDNYIYTNSFDSLKNRTFQLSLTLE